MRQALQTLRLTGKALQVAYVAVISKERFTISLFDGRQAWRSVLIEQSIHFNDPNTMSCTALANTKSAALICLSLGHISMVSHENCVQ